MARRPVGFTGGEGRREERGRERGEGAERETGVEVGKSRERRAESIKRGAEGRTRRG